MNSAPNKEQKANHSCKKRKANTGANTISLTHNILALNGGILSMHLAKAIPTMPAVTIPNNNMKITSCFENERTGFFMTQNKKNKIEKRY